MKQQQGKLKNNNFFCYSFLLYRTSILCHFLSNGLISSATWSGEHLFLFHRFYLIFFPLALNTTVANIKLFVYDANQQTQSLYGYAQDGVSIVRSDDRGLTWSVTDVAEYSNVRINFF
jgi:hypothetical protein